MTADPAGLTVVKHLVKYPLATVNPLYNISVDPQWFMTLKWICCCIDFRYFDHEMRKCRTNVPRSTWFAISESLISNLDKSIEACCRTIFQNQVFRLVHVLRNNSAKAKIHAKPVKIQAFSEDFSSRKWQWLSLTFAHSPLEHLMNN